jgi:hypothetical protein
VHLLFNSRVQEDLELTDQQKQKIDRLRSELLRRFQEGLAAAKKLAEGKEDAAEKQAIIRTYRSTSPFRETRHDADFLNILTKPQRSRLFQLRLQAAGVDALVRRDVQQALNLDPVQVATIQSLVQERFQQDTRLYSEDPPELAALRQATRPQVNSGTPLSPEQQAQFLAAREVASKKMDASRTELSQSMEQRVARILTRKQREKYRKMLGKPLIVHGNYLPKEDEPTDSKPAEDEAPSPAGGC